MTKPQAGGGSARELARSSLLNDPEGHLAPLRLPGTATWSDDSLEARSPFNARSLRPLIVLRTPDPARFPRLRRCTLHPPEPIPSTEVKECGVQVSTLIFLTIDDIPRYTTNVCTARFVGAPGGPSFLFALQGRERCGYPAMPQIQRPLLRRRRGGEGERSPRTYRPCRAHRSTGTAHGGSLSEPGPRQKGSAPYRANL